MPDYREFTYINKTGARWKVEVCDKPSARRLGLVRKVPSTEESSGTEEMLNLKDPQYVELYKELSGSTGPFTLQEMKLSEAEWAWLKGVLHSLMCDNANQVPIAATLVATSTAL
jgi:hypothetical protein